MGLSLQKALRPSKESAGEERCVEVAGSWYKHCWGEDVTALLWESWVGSGQDFRDVFGLLLKVELCAST